jgi:lysozyme
MGTERTALGLIKKWEGLHKVGKDGLVYAYLCPALVPTIGYGTVVPSLAFGPITKEVAERLCLIDVERSKKAGLAMSPILNEHPTKLDAITSFIYNLGQARYRQSTLRRKINEGDFQAAAFEINRWVWGGGRKLPGLIARRAEEAQWLLQD